jgi:hypothetical protein
MTLISTNSGADQRESDLRLIMPHPNFISLYVADATLRAHFYAEILGTPAIESAPTFAMFTLKSGVMLGLWNKASVLAARNSPLPPQVALDPDGNLLRAFVAAH